MCPVSNTSAVEPHDISDLSMFTSATHKMVIHWMDIFTPRYLFLAENIYYAHERTFGATKVLTYILQIVQPIT